MEVHKIIVSKSDEPTLIAEKILDTRAKDILLSVPRFSKLAESPSNFRLLRREAETLGKKIVVESIDEVVVELAKSSGLECVNPFFTESTRRFSDIVTAAFKGKRENQPRSKAEYSEDEEAEEQRPHILHREAAELAAHHAHPKHAENIHEPASKRKLSLGRKFIFGTSFIVLLGIIAAVVLTTFSKATLKITAAKTDWSFDSAVIVDKNIAVPNASALKIPGQIFVSRRNLELSFPATGKRNVSEKASGQITIYNEFSSSPQALVASTRFQTPEGKIFRLVETVTVPGAKVDDGKIKSSSIETKVIADKAGEAYNIGPVSKFTIPGFEGSPRFNAFYAESKNSMAGGFVGEKAYPTDKDIKTGKETVEKTMRDAVKTILLTQLPEGFKVLDGASSFKILKESVNPKVDSENKFPIFLEAEMSLVAFKEEHLLQMIKDKIVSEVSSDFNTKSYDLSYGEPRVLQGGMSMPVSYKAVLAKKIDLDLLKDRIRGRPATDLQALIFSVASLETAQISLWPSWISHVTDKPDRITIIVD